MRADGLKGILHILIAAAVIIASTATAQPLRGLKGITPEIKEEEPIRISADQITYDRKKDVYIASGEVVIVHADMILKADKVTFNDKTRTAVAEGNVEIIQRGDTVNGERMELNIDTKLGKMKNGRIFYRQGNVYISGKEIVRLGEERYQIIDGTFTTCNADVPDWRFTAKKADITVEGYAKIKGASFDVKNFPVVYFPYMIYPAKTKRQTGFLLPSYSRSLDKGNSVIIPFFWAISDSMDATFFGQYHSRRGYQPGLEYRYALTESTHGTYYFEYIKDRMEIDPTRTSRGGFPRTNENRWWIKLDHSQTLPSGVATVVDINQVSDNYYLDDFAGHREDRDLNYLNSTVNFTKYWGAYNLIADFQYFQDLRAPQGDNSETLQQLPRVSFNRSDQSIFKTPFYLQLDSSGTHYWRDFGTTGHVLDIATKLSLPLKSLQSIQFTPFFTFTETAWQVSPEKEKTEQGTRETWEYGGTLSTDLYRVFNTDSTVVQKLKHTIQPSITYSAIPDFRQENLPSEFVGRVSQKELITYSLTNYLIGKVYESENKFFYHDFIRFVLSQSYDLLEARRQLSGPTDRRRPFSDILAELELQVLPVSQKLDIPTVSENISRISAERNVEFTPHNSVYFDFEANYDPYDYDFSSFRFIMNVTDEWGDHLNLGYRINRNPELRRTTSEQFDGYLKLKILDSLDIFGEFNMDRLTKRFIFSTYGLDVHGQCWSIRVIHRDEPGVEGEPTRQETTILLTLFGLGPIIGAGI